jgi:hypothetical protein
MLDKPDMMGQTMTNKTFAEEGTKIVTNYHRLPILDGSDFTLKERKEFDYLDWDKLEKGTDSASFFRYKGEVYDLGEFSRVGYIEQFGPYGRWDAYQSDSFFSGIVVKYVLNDPDYDDSVIVGRYYVD